MLPLLNVWCQVQWEIIFCATVYFFAYKKKFWQNFQTTVTWQVVWRQYMYVNILNLMQQQYAQSDAAIWSNNCQRFGACGRLELE